MNELLIRNFIKAISDIVDAPGSWKEKRDAILNADEADDLDEFLSWFEIEELNEDS